LRVRGRSDAVPFSACNISDGRFAEPSIVVVQRVLCDRRRGLACSDQHLPRIVEIADQDIVAAEAALPVIIRLTAMLRDGGGDRGWRLLRSANRIHQPERFFVG
jgi:hypothetical protein